jgi:nucleoside-diphosphate-sugar epimerase
MAEAGLHPVAVVRRAGTMECETRLCDATDEASLREALQGAAGIVNCVAGDSATMIGATNAVAACAAGRRVVQLSSMAVYGDCVGIVTEAHPFADGGGWYAQAKIAGERALQKIDNAVCLRLGCIHGPRSEPWTARIGRLLHQGRIGDLGAAGDGRCNLVPIDDVVAAILSALTRTALGARAYNVGDPDPGTWNDYFMQFAISIGATPVKRIPARSLALEGKVLAPALKISQIVAGWAGRARLVPDPMPPSLLALWRQEIVLDHRAADRDLGFVRTPKDVALAAAAAWFRTEARKDR